MKTNKKANITMYFVFIILAIVIVLLASVIAPLGVRFNSEMYKAGEQILLDANKSISGIQNDTVRNAIQSSLSAAVSAGQNNIEVNANIFQYSWIFVIGLTAVVIFMYTRRIIEVGGGLV